MLKQVILCIFTGIFVFAFPSFNANAAITSYTTASGQLRITHNTADEGLYYDCNSNEIAQNIQILKADANTYHTIYHSEPKKTPGSAYPGDSIKSATQTGVFTYTIPSTKTFRIFGHPTDTASSLYSALTYDLNTASSGGANPMVVKGETDPNYYMLFMAVYDDSKNHSGTDFRRFLCEAKTPDFSSIYLRTLVNRTVSWKLFNESVDITWRRPDYIYDSTGAAGGIKSIRATDVTNAKGLTGSLCYYNGNYYYFYTDVNTDGRTYLYYRTITNISSLIGTDWSTATRVISSALMDDAIVRVAKAKDMDRWAVIYNGYREIDVNVYQQDVFVQYTQNMNIIGSGGISSLQLYDSFFDVFLCGVSQYGLGLSSSANDIYTKQYYMTDPYGALDTPGSVSNRGGLITWADGTTYGNNAYWAGWTASYTTTSYFIPADIDDDGDVDFKDLKEVTDSWLITDPTADLYVDTDNTINFKDFSVLNALWEVDRSYLAEICYPVVDKALPGAAVTFQWSAGYNVQEYYLKVGTAGVGSSNIFAGSTGTNQSQYVTGLPGDGSTVYVRIQSKINGVWCYNDYTYTGLTYNMGGMISPPNGTELQTPTVTFIWNKSTEPGTTNYWVDVGTTPGGWDINDSNQLGSDVNSWTCYNIPINGSTLYVRLGSRIYGQWYWKNYTYTTLSFPGTSYFIPADIDEDGDVDFKDLKEVTDSWLITDPNADLYVDSDNTINFKDFTVLSDLWMVNRDWLAEIAYPNINNAMSSHAATFQWSAGQHVREYYLDVGSTGAGSSDVFSGSTGKNQYQYVSGMPVDGNTVYLRLKSNINGMWCWNDYTYTAAMFYPAAMTIPAPSSILSDSSVTFQWSDGQNIQEYYLKVGTTGVGSSNIFLGSTGLSQSQLVAGLPMEGSTLYVRLGSRIDGQWYWKDYTYTSMSYNLAKMIIPTPFTGLPMDGIPPIGATVFQWTAGTDITSYSLDIGTIAGGTDILHGSDTTNKSQYVTGLPTNGSLVYVRLWSKASSLPGGALYNEYSYISGNTLSGEPNQPMLKEPDDYNSVGAVTSTNLKVHVRGPGSDMMSVTFYGREVNTTNDFRIVVYGDTQWWSYETEWLRPMWLHSAEVAISLDPAAVLHVGDISNDGDNNEAQWHEPNSAFELFDALNIPCLLTVGNHDRLTIAACAMYKKYFPISRYSSRPYWGGYNSIDSDHRWIKFSGGGMDFMVVSLEYYTGTIQSFYLDWANSVFSSNSNRRGIVLTHSILRANGTWNPECDGLSTYNSTAPNSNVFMMLCGHAVNQYSGGSVYRNVPYSGKDVHLMLFDFQNSVRDYLNPSIPIDYYGGWLRVLEFSPTTNQIQARTVRTWVYSGLTRPLPPGATNNGHPATLWDVNENCRYTMNYNMSNAASPTFSAVGTVKNVSPGTDATVTWSNLQADKTYEWFAVINHGTSKKTGHVWRFSTTSP